MTSIVECLTSLYNVKYDAIKCFVQVTSIVSWFCPSFETACYEEEYLVMVFFRCRQTLTVEEDNESHVLCLVYGGVSISS